MMLEELLITEQAIQSMTKIKILEFEKEFFVLPSMPFPYFLTSIDEASRD